MSEALLLATGAGLSTTIGSFPGISVRRPGDRFMSFTLGLSAGVMLLVSFVELLPTAIEVDGVGPVQAQLCFFAGLLTYFLIDWLVPHDYIGQHDHPGGESAHVQRDGRGLPPDQLYRTGVLVAFGLLAAFVGLSFEVGLRYGANSQHLGAHKHAEANHGRKQ